MAFLSFESESAAPPRRSLFEFIRDTVASRPQMLDAAVERALSSPSCEGIPGIKPNAVSDTNQSAAAASEQAAVVVAGETGDGSAMYLSADELRGRISSLHDAAPMPSAQEEVQ